MRIVLRVLSGARAGHTARFDRAHVAIGRHPTSDFQLDPAKDRDVSGKHAEIIARNGGYAIRDAGSTNGTWVNGQKLEGERILAAGDVVALGATGPKLEIAIERGSRWTARRLWRTAGGVAGLAGFAIGIAVTYSATHREAKKRESALDALLRRSDSVNAVLSAGMRDVNGRVSGLDSALSAARGESDSLRAHLIATRTGTNGQSAAVHRAAEQLQHAESREQLLATASRVDYARISRLDGPAVVLIAVEMPDGHAFTGTGFSVASGGLVVTNRHSHARR